MSCDIADVFCDRYINKCRSLSHNLFFKPHGNTEHHISNRITHLGIEILNGILS